MAISGQIPKTGKFRGNSLFIQGFAVLVEKLKKAPNLYYLMVMYLTLPIEPAKPQTLPSKNEDVYCGVRYLRLHD
ncbi:MAG: hypothetical protein ACHQYP_12975, partial [Nitrospiria bacterium]